MQKKVVIWLLVLMFIMQGCGKDNLITLITSVPATVEDEQEKIIEIPKAYQAKKHPVADSFAGGSGTIEDPYLIANAEQLTLWAEKINDTENLNEADKYSSAHYALTQDIVFNDLSDFDNWEKQAPAYKWEAVGCNINVFTGGFDGKGHVISGLYIIESGNDFETASRASRCSFISRLLNNPLEENSGYIRNLTIDKSYFRCMEGAVGAAGIAMSVKKGIVENCTSNVKIDYETGSNDVAGVVNSVSDGDVVNCVFGGVIKSTSEKGTIAGIVSDFYGGLLVDCTNNGTLITDAVAVGIARTISGTTEFVKESNSDDSNTEKVEKSKLTLVQNCVNNADIKGNGLFGVLNAGKGKIQVSNCINNGTINEGSGIIGRVNSRVTTIGNASRIPGELVVENCINKGNIDAVNVEDSESVGGCIGKVFFSSAMTIKNCVNEGDMKGNSGMGGIIGTIMSIQDEESIDAELVITDCINKGTIEGIDLNVGGIVGSTDFYSEDANIKHKITISNSVNEGKIVGGGYGVGGIMGTVIGLHGGVGDEVTLVSNTNNGEVNGLLPMVVAGGIVGYYPKGEQTQSIIDCTNNGTVTLISDENTPFENDRKFYYGIASEIVGAAQEGVELNGNVSSGKIGIDEQYKDSVLQDEEIALWMKPGDGMITWLYE